MRIHLKGDSILTIFCSGKAIHLKISTSDVQFYIVCTLPVNLLGIYTALVLENLYVLELSSGLHSDKGVWHSGL